jgi:hypothetical protein
MRSFPRWASLAFCSSCIACHANRVRAQEREPALEPSVEFPRAHFVGIRLEWGTATTYGIFYVHDWARSSDAVLYTGVGAEVALMTENHSVVDAVVFGPLGRSGAVGGGGGAEAMYHVGVAYDGSEFRPVSTVGAFYSVRYLSLGYTYGFPIFPAGDRPKWLSSHSFGVRAAIPTWTY